ncbi:hypothetical protein [Archangium lansingense]|uniref:Uncharacterized protein n=1 Tax=Archangium lansingense TaxID=2995310 RepID=A0ABT4AF13_9BACT|nr:hypothetical protein [Archangium lansinium]MCY1080281.1 hypothetical protein [Archangium lansinium]
MLSSKKWFPSVHVLAVLSVLGASVALAGTPPPYTIDTKTGLSRTAESNLFHAVRRMVDPVAKALGFNEAENQCAQATAAEALIKATQEAMSGKLFGLSGGDDALRHFKQGQDDWCNKQGGKRGAEAIAPYASQAQSFMRPFLQERFEGLKAQKVELTPTVVAAAIAAALLALPALAPL